ncbi:MAG: hypothetical protein ABW193_12720, partial [Luteibacter sp.]
PMPSTPPPAAMPVPSAPAAPAKSMAPVEPAPVVSSREDALYGYAAAGNAEKPTAGADPSREMGQLEAAKSAPVLGPDDRVGDIRRLLDRGQREEALRRLRELRRLYPRYDLPQDLRDLKP